MSDQALREHVIYLLKDGGAHLNFEKAIVDLPKEFRGKETPKIVQPHPFGGSEAVPLLQAVEKRTRSGPIQAWTSRSKCVVSCSKSSSVTSTPDISSG